MGLADVACGLDSNSPEEPDYRPIGLLRLVLLQERSELVDEAANALFEAAHQFWRGCGGPHQGLPHQHGLPLLSSGGRHAAG